MSALVGWRKLRKEYASDVQQRQEDARVRDFTAKGLSNLLLEEVAVDQAAKRQRRRDAGEEAEQDERESNRVFLLSLESQLQNTTGLTFKDFMPKQRNLPLTESQVRKYVRHPHPITGELERRSVVQDNGTGDRRFESPRTYVDGVYRSFWEPHW